MRGSRRRRRSIGPRVSGGPCSRTMSTYSRTSGSMACTAWPATWAPTAPETARAAASGGRTPW
eukprot:9541916-Alexandrium_andersonii.AAC.1